MQTDQIKLYEHITNPVIKPPFATPVIADPTFLTPDMTPDGKWHLWAHSVYLTVTTLHHYTSEDGINWKKDKGTFHFLGMRPYIYKEEDTYYLFFEKLDTIFQVPFYDSHLEVMTSQDLINWNTPQTVMLPTLSWHKTFNTKGNVGNPFLSKKNGKYELYYSAGLNYLKDCWFCEPQSVGIAVSNNILGPYHANSVPLYTNATADLTLPFITAHRFVEVADLFLGFQTHVHYEKKLSRSYIKTVISQNLTDWQDLSHKANIEPTTDWKSTHIYACDAKIYKGIIYIYFNARAGRSLINQECIGLATIKL